MGDRMTVTWGTYIPFDPGVAQPLHEVSRADAREAFRRLIAAKPGRIDELRNLLGRNGITLSDSDEELQIINDWFRAEVEGEPGSRRLIPYWYAVVNDLSLFLGDVIICRAPSLEWRFFDKGKKDVAYQRHVLMGFNVPNPKYNVDIDLLLAGYGHRIVLGKEVEPDAFLRWVRSTVAEA